MKNSVMFCLEGKKAVITGGAGVLGTGIAQALGHAGADIAVCDIRDAGNTVKRLKTSGVRAKGFYIDVLQKDSINACCEEVMDEFGRIDILVNAAGGNVEQATTSGDREFFDIPLAAMEKVVGLNLFGGAILPAQVFGKKMIKNKSGGSVINISSMNAFRPLTRIAGYSAAKAAVSNFTQWLAVHFAMDYNPKLRVNAIAPGFFLTEQNRYLLLDKKTGRLTARGKSVIDHTPMSRFGQPEELNGAVIWLASDASSFVTGTVVVIDGGFSAFAGV